MSTDSAKRAEPLPVRSDEPSKASDPETAAGRRGLAVPTRPTHSDRARSALRRIIDRLSTGDGTLDAVPLSDVLLAAVLVVPAIVTYVLDPGDGIAVLSPIGWLGWGLLATMFVPLAWRRVTPSLTMTVTGLSTGAWFVIGFSDGFVPLAVIVALYSICAYGSRADGITSLLVTQFFVTVSLLSVRTRTDGVSGVDIAINLLIFFGIWALGDRTRVRRELVAQLTARAEQAERSRELATDLAVSDERARIARELHDVVAHTVSVMVVQAGAGRRIASNDPDGAVEALSSIEAIGRDALGDLRRMVGILRQAGNTGELTPQPTLAQLPELIERLAAAGLPVHLRLEGRTRPLPSGVELCAYRIVQEALTNVLRHAGSVRDVQVALEHGTEALTVTITDDGRGAAAREGDSSGSGLVGMRERVALFSGTLDARPASGGGFRVRATLPISPSNDDQRGVCRESRTSARADTSELHSDA